MKTITLRIIRYSHSNFFFPRRVKILSGIIAQLLPLQGRVLDVGCGDGIIDQKIIREKPHLTIQGIDILKRKDAVVPVDLFDGKRIPFPDNFFDYVLLIDTLHHASSPFALLKEARRVAKKSIIIKDHCPKTNMDRILLRLFDWVGNRPYNVSLPYNYLSPRQWEDAWRKLGTKVEKRIDNIRIYPFPFSILVDRSFNFAVKLAKNADRANILPHRDFEI